MDNGRIMKELKELQDAVKNVRKLRKMVPMTALARFFGTKSLLKLLTNPLYM